MLLLDRPNISNFLKDTIKEHYLPVIATQEAWKQIDDISLNWVSEADAIKELKSGDSPLLYTNSENTIKWIQQHLKGTELLRKVRLFKNKIRFRELIRDIYPFYYFRGIDFEDLERISPTELKFPLVLKPAVGSLSMGVRKVHTAGQWTAAVKAVKEEINTYKGSFPDVVMNTSNFMVEEFIDGEEYSIDCYFDADGEPVILNILQHIFPSGEDRGERVYTTSKEIIAGLKDRIEAFLRILGQKTALANFPLHLDVRINEKDNIIPIEGNPLRFGGLCTSADLAHHAYGFNSYDYYLRGKRPDWNSILKDSDGRKYSVVALGNNSGVKGENVLYFDYDSLLSDFRRPLCLRKIDIEEYPFFGMLFVETRKGQEDELEQILTSNLLEYIREKDASSINNN
ncbi:ATP-grasp domain-containing protein [Leptobacterium flavescens]|uniref:ATP-grasp domain-containing protein n=1 Tax=Leptobacterium flavescens TaxID=472055 RepID=A0A6P0UJA6_9FLAO|nr:ATP-grasp domain-containing protein [Leptobacterium flavescens]NER13375.1 ATP-grasp domain-containing protein [Leptobacterium flavescens]